MSRIVGGIIVLALVTWLLNPFACCPGGNWIHSRMDKVSDCSCTSVERQSMQPDMQPSTACSQLATNLRVLNSGLSSASQVTPMLPIFITITGGQITYITSCQSVNKLDSVFTADIEEPPRV